MEPVAPASRTLAAALIAHGTSEAGTPQDLAAGAQKAWQRLHDQLWKVLGAVGFYALLNRSLIETRKQFPWLANIQAESGGSLKGLQESVVELSLAETTDGLVVLLAYFLHLLVSLIGVALTMRLVERTWPEMDLSEIGTHWEEVES